MSIERGFTEESLRKIAEQKVNFRSSVKIHASIFVLANSILFLINCFFTPEFFWILITIFSWLIGLVMHFLAYLLYARGVYPIAKRVLIYTFFAYIFGILQLLVINYITLKEINWAIIPAVFGGAGVLVYSIIYLIFFRRTLIKEGDSRSRKDRAIEKEMKKMRRRMAKLKE